MLYIQKLLQKTKSRTFQTQYASFFLKKLIYPQIKCVEGKGNKDLRQMNFEKKRKCLVIYNFYLLIQSVSQLIRQSSRDCIGLQGEHFLLINIKNRNRQNFVLFRNT